MPPQTSGAIAVEPFPLLLVEFSFLFVAGWGDETPASPLLARLAPEWTLEASAFLAAAGSSEKAGGLGGAGAAMGGEATECSPRSPRRSPPLVAPPLSTRPRLLPSSERPATGLDSPPVPPAPTSSLAFLLREEEGEPLLLPRTSLRSPAVVAAPAVAAAAAAAAEPTTPPLSLPAAPSAARAILSPPPKLPSAASSPSRVPDPSRLRATPPRDRDSPTTARPSTPCKDASARF